MFHKHAFKNWIDMVNNERSRGRQWIKTTDSLSTGGEGAWQHSYKLQMTAVLEDRDHRHLWVCDRYGTREKEVHNATTVVTFSTESLSTKN